MPHPLTLLSDDTIRINMIILWLFSIVITSVYLLPHVTENTYTYSYEYKTQQINNGILTDCNMCMYTYNNKLYTCPQNYLANCIPYNTTCSATIDAYTGQCNDFTLHKIAHIHETINWFVAIITMSVFAFIVLESHPYFMATRTILQYKHSLEDTAERNQYQPIVELHPVNPIANAI